jgi:hypothetical protein
MDPSDQGVGYHADNAMRACVAEHYALASVIIIVLLLVVIWLAWRLHHLQAKGNKSSSFGVDGNLPMWYYGAQNDTVGIGNPVPYPRYDPLNPATQAGKHGMVHATPEQQALAAKTQFKFDDEALGEAMGLSSVQALSGQGSALDAQLEQILRSEPASL